MNYALIVRSAGFPQIWVDELVDMFKSRDITFIIADDNCESISSQIGSANILIGCPRHIFTPELLSKAVNLKWVHGTGAGVEQFIFSEFVKSDVLFTNGRIIQGPEVADHAVALLLSISRNIARFYKGQKYNEMPRAIELRKKTALIHGTGGIGQLVAERLKAFGMKTIGIGNDLPPMLNIFDEFHEPNQIYDLLPLVDVLVSCAPYTKSTSKFFNKTIFNKMKSSSIFINVSRGTVVDTEDLTDAVSSGHFMGVGLDVTDPEPLNDDHPLLSLPNVLITPHMAGPSDHNRRRSFDLICTNIERYLGEEKLFNIVDKCVGY